MPACTSASGFIRITSSLKSSHFRNKLERMRFSNGRHVMLKFTQRSSVPLKAQTMSNIILTQVVFHARITKTFSK